ncbi:C40 family peptidase [Candidatus Planktophila lacus]|uniref:Cell wall hydrolase n=1 Tax=Candidatus Planktophila lacus TaxID=1884913 RepID=A0AAD0E4E0_9ACTN|nr:NlpC/P60 family protein [Candidatus Planktophila lacus]ASY10401.1 cell wall hydrolase [Candidatus Planktophila lacus]
MTRFKLAITSTLVLILAFSSGVTPLLATNHKPTLAQIEAAKKAELAKKKIADEAFKKLAKARGNLKALIQLANAADQKYQRARAALAIAVSQSQQAQAAYEVAVAAVAGTHREIGKLALNAYISGGGLTDLESILSSNGPQDVIDRLSTLDNLGEGNRTALKRFKVAEDIAEAAKTRAEVAKANQAAVTVRVAAAKKEADDARSEQQKEVDKLQAVQDKLQRDLASAKKVRITLEQKRQLAILEETRANEATKTKTQSKIWKGGGPTGVSRIRTTEEQRLKVVEFAKKQVLAGKPYIWGSEGPNAFDCSGLVYAAFKSVGLGWPIWDRLNSSLYYTYTKQIPIAEMQPGDLIFYSYKGTQSTIHHMSIYAGNGMMWEARSTKTGLRYSNIYSVEGMMPYAGRV